MACFFILFAVTVSQYRYLTIFYVALGLTKLPELVNNKRLINAKSLVNNKIS